MNQFGKSILGLALLMTLLFTACGGGNKEDEALTKKRNEMSGFLVGTWIFDNIERADALPEAFQQTWDAMKEEMKASNAMTFDSEGNMEMKVKVNGELKVSKGTWEISRDAKSVVADLQNSDRQFLKVAYLNSSELAFVNTEGGILTTTIYIKE